MTNDFRNDFRTAQRLKLVKKALSNFPRYAGVEANERLILDACRDGAMSLEITHAAVARLHHQLVVSPIYKQAYSAFFERHPEYAMQGNISLFDAALRELGLGEEISVELLEDLFHPGHPSSVRPHLSLNAEALQTQADAKEKARLIAEISRGQLTYSARDQYGKVQVYVSAELDGESTERLREIAGIVSEQRRLLALPAGDQKREINASLKTKWTAKTEKSPSPLPPEYSVPGKVGVSYPWSRNLLVQLHVKAPEEYKRLQRLYSEQVIADLIVNNGIKK